MRHHWYQVLDYHYVDSSIPFSLLLLHLIPLINDPFFSSSTSRLLLTYIFTALLLLLNAFFLHWYQFCCVVVVVFVCILFSSFCISPQPVSHSLCYYLKSLRERIWYKLWSYPIGRALVSDHLIHSFMYSTTVCWVLCLSLF